MWGLPERKCLSTFSCKRIPFSFILKMHQLGRLSGSVRQFNLEDNKFHKVFESRWNLAQMPDGEWVVSARLAKMNIKKQAESINPDFWSVAQEARNCLKDTFIKAVQKLWEDAQLAAAYFTTPASDDAINVEPVPPAQIEA